MKTARAVIFMSVIAASGCFNPDDIFPLHGQVVSAGGVEGLEVQLLRAQEAEITGACESEFKPFKTTTTDADGNFTFEVFRAQTQSLGQRGFFCFRVRVTFGSGTVAETDLQAVAGETQLSKFYDWQPNARLENGVVVLTPPFDVNAVDGGTLTQRTNFETDGGLAWVVDDVYFDSFTQTPLPARPMPFGELEAEDFVGELTFDAVAGERLDDGIGVFGGFSFNAVRITPAQRIAVTGTRTPLSRGATCSALATPCPLTDGLLEPVELGARSALTIDLGTAKQVSNVVFRELEVGAPIIVAQFFDADGGLALTQQGTFDYSQRALSSLPRRRNRDGGMMVSFGATEAWPVVSLDGGVLAKKVTFQFPGGVNSVLEISLY
jgi:hypothetical protein